MATSKGHIARPPYRFLPGFPIDKEYSLSDSTFEFDESDLYNSARANSPEFRKTVLRASRFPNNSSSTSTSTSTYTSSSGGRPASLPVNVPDWSKILGDEYRHNNRRKDNLDDDDESDVDVGFDGERVPPHEFLARTRIASLSVHEGVGRTLKGRDLSRVRNAIWAKTGFQD